MIGNLTRDIELKYLPSGAAIAKSAIATSFKFKSSTGEQKEEVCFLDFNVFGKSAEVINQYTKKGSKVLLEGRLVLEQWTAQDGTNRSKHSLRVENFKFLDSRSDNQTNPYNQGEYAPQQNYNQPQQPYTQPQPTYQEPQQPYNQAQVSGGMAQANQAIPEIDVNEDVIPF
jgi:single-strand DNA-binding protein